MKTTFPVLAVLCGFLAIEFSHKVVAETNEIAESNFAQLRHKRAVPGNPGGTPVIIGEKPVVKPGPVVPGPAPTTKKTVKKPKSSKRPKQHKPGKRPPKSKGTKKSSGPKKDKKSKASTGPKKDKKSKVSKGPKKDKAKGAKKSKGGKKAKDAKPAGP